MQISTQASQSMLRSAIAACNICGRPVLRQSLVPALTSPASSASASRSVRTHARRNMAKELLELQKERAAAPAKEPAVPTGAPTALQPAKHAVRPTVKDIVFEAPLRIVLYPDPRLRAVNAKVGVFGEPVKRLAAEMFRVMYEYVLLACRQQCASCCRAQGRWRGPGSATGGRQRARDGLQPHGMCASTLWHSPCGIPPCGIPHRVPPQGVKGEGKEMILVNPEIVSRSNATELDGEGCLSFPGIYGDIEVCHWWYTVRTVTPRTASGQHQGQSAGRGGPPTHPHAQRLCGENISARVRPPAGDALPRPHGAGGAPGSQGAAGGHGGDVLAGAP